jgi:hypothetical protein
LGLASPPSLAPPLLAPPSLLLVSRQDYLERIKKAPRERGFCFALEISISAATSVAPHGAVRTHATGPHHDDRSRRHDDRGWTNHNGPAIGLATTIGPTVPAGAASAGGFRRAEAGNGAQGQNCCEKVFHVLSHLRPLGRHGSEPIHEQLNGI